MQYKKFKGSFFVRLERGEEILSSLAALAEKEDIALGCVSGLGASMDGKPYLHLHMSASNEYGKVTGGHLNEAHVSATCEIVVRVVDGSVGRAFSDEIGLNLFEF